MSTVWHICPGCGEQTLGYDAAHHCWRCWLVRYEAGLLAAETASHRERQSEPLTAAVTDAVTKNSGGKGGTRQPSHSVACQVCDRPFVARRGDARFCSARCRQRASRKRHQRAPRHRLCRGCGQWFQPRSRSQWYCAARCRMRGLRWRRVQATVQRWRREDRALQRRTAKR